MIDYRQHVFSVSERVFLESSPCFLICQFGKQSLRACHMSSSDAAVNEEERAWLTMGSEGTDLAISPTSR